MRVIPSALWRQGPSLPFGSNRVRLRLSDGLAGPHPPAPSPALRARGWMLSLYAKSHTSSLSSLLSKIIPRWYANDRLLLPTRLLA